MTSDTTFWGQVFLFITTIAGFAFQAWREGRNRRWEEERERRLAAKVEDQKRELTVKIEENTALTARGIEVSEEAVRVGNNFNAKLLTVTNRFDELGARERLRTAERLERIDTTALETSKRVERIDDTTQDTNEHVRNIAGDERPVGR